MFRKFDARDIYKMNGEEMLNQLVIFGMDEDDAYAIGETETDQQIRKRLIKEVAKRNGLHEAK